MSDFIQISTATASKKEAEDIARSLLENRLAGCVQILGPVASTYWWQETIESAEEWLCIIKTRSQLYDQAESLIKRLHSYTIPEILSTPVLAGNRDYLLWLEKETMRPIP